MLMVRGREGGSGFARILPLKVLVSSFVEDAARVTHFLDLFVTSVRKPWHIASISETTSFPIISLCFESVFQAPATISSQTVSPRAPLRRTFCLTCSKDGPSWFPYSSMSLRRKSRRSRSSRMALRAAIRAHLRCSHARLALSGSERSSPGIAPWREKSISRIWPAFSTYQTRMWKLGMLGRRPSTAPSSATAPSRAVGRRQSYQDSSWGWGSLSARTDCK